MKKQILFILVMALTGCSSLGEPFTTLENPEKGKSMVYFYRPSKFVGSAITFSIKDEEKFITKMPNGSYYPHSSAIGNKTFATDSLESDDKVNMLLEEGKTYFIRSHISMGVFVGHPKFTVVPENIAIEELKQCREVLADD